MSTENQAPAPASNEAPAPSPAPAPSFQRRPRRDNNRDRNNRSNDSQQDGPSLIEKVVFINRCAKVVKGGRRFSFAALAVVGDGKGKVGIGYGKANEVPDAIKKSTENAKKHFVNVKLKGDTLPHDVLGCADGGKVLLKPASPGTGLIAGGGVRAVLEAAGVKNVLTKSMGSKNHIAVVHATLNGLLKLRLAQDISALRKIN
jgi:small subunit ribosomal protein S5